MNEIINKPNLHRLVVRVQPSENMSTGFFFHFNDQVTVDITHTRGSHTRDPTTKGAYKTV